MSPLYVLSLSGTAFERGLTYGKVAREKILKAIAFYSHLFEGMAGISWDKANLFCPSSRITIPRRSRK